MTGGPIAKTRIPQPASGEQPTPTLTAGLAQVILQIPSVPIPAARGLLANASISSGIRLGQASAVTQVIKPFLDPLNGPLSTKSLLRAPIRVPPGLEPIDLRPDWAKNPENYYFPPGFPMTPAEFALSVQALTLITSFGKQTTSISSTLTDQIRSASPQWRIPNSSKVNFDDPNQVKDFLNGCDDAIAKADVESRQFLQKSLFDLGVEAGNFLTKTNELVFASQFIFEDYWQGQLLNAMNESFGYIDYYTGVQRTMLDNLRTQLTLVDINKKAAEQAQQNQENTCQKLVKEPAFWALVIVAPASALAALAGWTYDPLGHGIYPQTPDDPPYDPWHDPSFGT